MTFFSHHLRLRDVGPKFDLELSGEKIHVSMRLEEKNMTELELLLQRSLFKRYSQKPVLTGP